MAGLIREIEFKVKFALVRRPANSLLPIRRCQPSRVTRENVTLFGTGLS